MQMKTESTVNMYIFVLSYIYNMRDDTRYTNEYTVVHSVSLPEKTNRRRSFDTLNVAPVNVILYAKKLGKR